MYSFFEIWQQFLVLQLVPLYVRITAISELATSGKQMERVRLNLTTLFIKVTVVAGVLAAFLLAWTIVDSPKKTFEYEMTTDKSPKDETIVRAYPFCGQEQGYWIYVVFGWRALILFPSCMMAVLSCRVKEDLNDTRALSSALYTHVVCLVLQIISFLVLYQSAESDLMGYSSIILSGDTISSLALYILPKFLNSGEEFEDEPLPDIFVHTTIALLNVEGFTAWYVPNCLVYNGFTRCCTSPFARPLLLQEQCSRTGTNLSVLGTTLWPFRQEC